MDIRKISINDLGKAVHAAYEDFKDLKKGEPAEEYKQYNPGKFAISVCLADGRRIDRGDVDAKFPLGGLGKIAVATQLLTQMPVEELVKKSGAAPCGCKCAASAGPQVPEVLKGKGFHPTGVRAMSLVEPTGDPEGKWNNVMNLLISLMGTAPVLDDDLYKATMEACEKNNEIDTLAANDFYLYDDASIAIKLYMRLHSMLVTTAQLAQMGGTIVADGVNPDTREIVFDGALAQNIASIIAARGPRNMGKPWLIMTGTPATCTKTGGFLAVIPGVIAIAAYSPTLNPAGVPVQAAMAVKEILQSLGLNALSSARVEFVD